LFLNNTKDKVIIKVAISQSKLDELERLGAIKKNSLGRYRGVSKFIDESLLYRIGDYHYGLD